MVFSNASSQEALESWKAPDYYSSNSFDSSPDGETKHVDVLANNDLAHTNEGNGNDNETKTESNTKGKLLCSYLIARRVEP